MNHITTRTATSSPQRIINSFRFCIRRVSIGATRHSTAATIPITPIAICRLPSPRLLIKK